MFVLGHWGFEVAPGWRLEMDSGSAGDRRHDDAFLRGVLESPGS